MSASSITTSFFKKLSLENCAHCHVNENLQKCTACFAVVYCSVDCQKAEWPQHKKECAQLSFKGQLACVPQCDEGHPYLKYPFFLCTNEINEGTYSKLKNMQLAHTTLVAVSGFFALNLLALQAVKSNFLSHLIMFDVSKKVAKAWEWLEKAIIATPQRNSVIEKIKNYFTTEKSVYFSEDTDQSEESFCKAQMTFLEKEIITGDSWLSTDAKYEKVRSVFQRRWFVFLRMDLREERSFQKLGEVLKTQQLKVGILYLSNIFEVIKTFSPEKISSYQQAIGSLIEPDETVIIQTSPRHCLRCPLKQKVKILQKNKPIASLFSDVPSTQCAASSEKLSKAITSLESESGVADHEVFKETLIVMKRIAAGSLTEEDRIALQDLLLQSMQKLMRLQTLQGQPS